jgi:ribosomal protein S18 acetylase RimI-like enzyme
MADDKKFGIKEIAPMKLIIRPFDMEDYERVIILWRDAGLTVRPQGRDSAEKIRRQINNGTSILLVGEINKEIAGTVLGTQDGRKGWINRLAVVPGYRRLKIASRLVKELEGRFDQMGLEITACLIETDNKISQEFFKGLGYEEWSGKYFSKRKSLES